MGSAAHSAGGAGADAEQQQRTEHEAEHGAAQRAQRGGFGRRRVGAQHRQRAEHHPEPVLHAGYVGHQDRRGQRQRPAQAVQEPDRTEAGVPGQDADRAGDRGRPPLRHRPLAAGRRTSRGAGRRSSPGRPGGWRSGRPPRCSLTTSGDRLRVEGVPGDDLAESAARRPRIPPALRRPMVGGGGLALPVQRGPCRAPSWSSGQQVAGLPEHHRGHGRAGRDRPARPGPGSGARRSRRRPARCTTRAAGPRWPCPGRPWPGRPAGTACWRTRVISWCLASWQAWVSAAMAVPRAEASRCVGQRRAERRRGRAQPVSRGRRRDQQHDGGRDDARPATSPPAGPGSC